MIWIILTISFFIIIVVFFKKENNREFTITINKKVIKYKGIPPNKFINEIKDINRWKPNMDGKIYGEKDNEKINIKFSKTITQSERQVILNIWYNIIKK